MVNPLILRLIKKYGPQIFMLFRKSNIGKKMENDIKEGFKKTVNENLNNEESNKNEEKKEEDKEKTKNKYSWMSWRNLIQNPMTKEEAIKILDLQKENEITHSLIMKKYNHFIQMNIPEKGGSFYLMNKFHYAMEFLVDIYPPNEKNQQKEQISDEINRDINDKV